jgi:hypothetical protein
MRAPTATCACVIMLSNLSHFNVRHTPVLKPWQLARAGRRTANSDTAELDSGADAAGCSAGPALDGRDGGAAAAAAVSRDPFEVLSSHLRVTSALCSRWDASLKARSRGAGGQRAAQAPRHPGAGRGRAAAPEGTRPALCRSRAPAALALRQAHRDGLRQDFGDLWARKGLPKRLRRNVEACGYAEPTPIQRQAIPLLLAGREVLAAAPTGALPARGRTVSGGGAPGRQGLHA